jgi:hypothetical protein
MTKTQAHSKEGSSRFLRLDSAKRAHAHAVSWKTLWKRSAIDIVDDDESGFDDELVRLVDDCARRAMS